MDKVFQLEFESGIFEIYNDKPNHLDLLHTHQTHSPLVINNKDEMNTSVKADGLILPINELRGNAFAIKTADCLPILYLSDTHVALVHAGWRGIQQNIHLDKKLIAMKPHTVFIGPAIGVKSFEVTSEFYDYFPESKNFTKKKDKLTFDLTKEAVSQLNEVFLDTKITSSGICTFENNQYIPFVSSHF